MTQEKIKVAVVGGGIGRQHLEGFSKLKDKFDVTFFCDLDAEKCSSLAQEFSIPYTTQSFDELCERDDIDAIDICTPPFLHFDQIVQALESGKNVICEKPLVGTSAEVDKLRDVSNRTGKYILPIFQYRYGSGVEKLLFLKQQGILGKPLMANIEVAWHRGKDYFSVPWRRKKSTYLGGCLMDQSIHMHDLVCLVMGDVKSVTAKTRQSIHTDIETEDTAVVIMEMENGALVTESITLGAHGEKTRLKFFFENMTVISDHDQQYKPQDEPWSFMAANADIERQMAEALLMFKPTEGSYAGLFSEYYDCVMVGKDLPVNLDDAYRSIKLVNNMYRSDEEGRTIDYNDSKVNTAVQVA